MIIGIAAGPDQIADGTDPSILAKVDAAGNVSVTTNAMDASGAIVPLRADDSNEILRQSLSVSRAMLLVLVSAFHPSSDPQSFIDAVE